MTATAAHSCRRITGQPESLVRLSDLGGRTARGLGFEGRADHLLLRKQSSNLIRILAIEVQKKKRI